MATDATRITLGTEAVEIAHADHDYSAGYAFVARCDTAVVYYGGPGVTPANGYDKPIGQEFGQSNTGDITYAVVAPGDEGAELKVFWTGV